jgi:uncharacterized protein YbjQ (UPF0145 family)
MFKKLIPFSLCLLLASPQAFARDTQEDYSISDALNRAPFQEKLGSEVKFYFGDQKHGQVIQRFGEARTNKKTNAFNKSDEEACQWAFLSALIALRDRAIKDGGNAVVNIQSNYKDKTTTSNDTFRCGAGGLMAGVALIGTVVKTKD